MENEIWEEIIGFEGCYEISNLGNVKSVYRFVNGRNNQIPIREKILKFGVNPSGYRYVNLRKHDISKNTRVHRLVGIHFIPNPLNLPCLNHIDGNKINNLPSNLEWCTHRENCIHAWDTGLAKISDLSKETTRKRVSVKVIDSVTKQEFRSIKEAAAFHNLTPGCLYAMLAGKNPNRTNLFKLE